MFPAKSGKEENSMLNETKASNGTPAPADGASFTEITEALVGGPKETVSQIPRVPRTNTYAKIGIFAISDNFLGTQFSYRGSAVQ